MPTPVDVFATRLLQALRKADADADAIEVRVRGKQAVFGIADDDEWGPLFRVAVPSGSANVMTLQVRHGNAWATTGVRGVPQHVADALTGPLAYIWKTPLRMSALLAR